MRITPCGAVGEVTGSGYLVETEEARVLVDFGSFQGTPDASERNQSFGPVDPTRLDAIVLTHAHTDHTGRLPLLAGRGCVAPVWGTEATLDLTMLLLRDAAGHAAEDLARLNRRRFRAGQPPLRGLYDREDIERLETLMRPLPYDRVEGVAHGITIRYRENGHILGSTNIEMSIRDGERHRTVVFSGDIGPKGSPILRDPVPPTAADLVFLESTYGDRDHGPQTETIARFHELLRDAMWQHKVVIIPAFAIGRTQSVLYHIAEGIRSGALPEFPIYLDSPMASKATATYRKHQDLYDQEAHHLSTTGALREALGHLVETDSVEASKRLNDMDGSCVIIAGGGMCEGGRVVHHLKHHLPSNRAEIFVVGYMADGTLGRELVDGAKQVVIDRDPIAVRAAVRKLNGFSAHAGQSELVEWLGAMVPSSKGRGPRVVLTHGENPQRAALAMRVRERFGIEAELPMPGDIIEL
ncbi:MAG: MBL fold metallo-hydrolase [Phycisphaerae bacterium]|jgi:metallo-beta-lactamase family protein|nr:MBL fold metallo-hydrolase [Phycisphaerae bacterium]